MANAFCNRCRQMGYVTKSSVAGGVAVDYLVIVEEVRLCGVCRAKAKHENDTAMYRESRDDT